MYFNLDIIKELISKFQFSKLNPKSIKYVVLYISTYNVGDENNKGNSFLGLFQKNSGKIPKSMYLQVYIYNIKLLNKKYTI